MSPDALEAEPQVALHLALNALVLDSVLLRAIRDHTQLHSGRTTYDEASYDCLAESFERRARGCIRSEHDGIYQAYNTALCIDSSILFNGAYEAVDRMQRKEFANGDLRDGVGTLCHFCVIA